MSLPSHILRPTREGGGDIMLFPKIAHLKFFWKSLWTLSCRPIVSSPGLAMNVFGEDEEVSCPFRYLGVMSEGYVMISAMR